MTPRPSRWRRRRPPTAFSLVEVVLAIGVISFCLLTVLGLMPVGLSTLRRAMDTTTETQIVKQIGGNALLTPYSKLGTDFSGKSFYFNADGQAETVVSADTRYEVKTSLTNAAYPGSDRVGAAMTNSMTTLRLELATGPKVNGAPRSTNIYHIRIPNSGG